MREGREEREPVLVSDRSIVQLSAKRHVRSAARMRSSDYDGDE